ncbi:N, N'-diacetylbacillosaminyl-diphospho-undecaprenol alpha-1,3-N-acetylgalactosaminyltransferase [Vibrio crassostreae]|uniref:glycosyltransferase family 4 protein n=1 Tax=Vibrio crassostreae TaxID=246167 RepID=UPI001B312D7C|nr:glycosyltransferase [Vibrio crassostreae]CAK1935130.1 N, N'-diacetylbacillosaminyl-diphospho-undecaprenol alpha-1,3-N-acetylgalactosaminyltransferase [Vibrio crassostreae]CAK1940433.1 N, N'-diacetylbacillosaminyl-diphospho-undecaprenol alpha-1,3-N-acetylgalactosaminyltransferase [Vibrio crassostreae]CAK1941032.1 N, N'-diacetylbacillosaminyl-diphospho-undecaprenol alpha-1,3-N-acetylgalactosaminyltransferase [Vibrio crassostreae]CAK1944978.1 N, N'-diacetylbacillosaminyl-diphospho-undecaprenol 
MKIIVANTVIGKPGNIGLRYSKIIKRNEELSGDIIYHYCRYSLDNSKGCLGLGVFGRVPRILNAIRIYVFKNFNHRKWDVLWFEAMFLMRMLPFLFKNCDKGIGNTAIINEPSILIIKILKRYGFKIIYDFPIAPFSYADEFVKEYGVGHGIRPNVYISNREKLCYPLVDEFIVPSQFVYDEIFDYSCGKKIWNIPFGVDCKETIRTDEKVKNKIIKFYFAGVINKRKGIQNLLEAWGEFDDFCELHLCGRLFPEIHDIIKDNKFKNVFTPGFVNFNEYISPPGVYVFPSLLEGSSKSIYEAMNLGLPIICTKESGSIITHGVDGWLIEKMNSEDIKEKMMSFVIDNSLIFEMGEKARKNVKLYSWNKYADEVMGVIN